VTVVTVTIIRCDGLECQERLMPDPKKRKGRKLARDMAMQKGWYVHRETAFCPACRLKYIKPEVRKI
jgi:hypothetical protein